MSEQIPEVPAVEPGANPEENKTPEPVDIQAQLDAATKAIEEKFKTEIAGLNRKNSEYEKEIKQRELEGKTEAEQTEALKLEKEALLKENEKILRDRVVDKGLNNAELPLEFAKRIIGEDEIAIAEDIKSFQDLIETTAQARADKIINERLAGKAPETGDTPKAGIDEQIKAAQKKGDFVAVMALKEQKRLA